MVQLRVDESLLHDINEAFDYIESFNVRLDESWLHGIESPYFEKHYKDHVLQPGERWKEYPSISSDGEYRIKMPRMSREDYENRADKLASESDVYPTSDTVHNFIGGIAIRLNGELKKEAFVKIKRHSDFVVPAEDAEDNKTHSLFNMCEIVVYIKAADGSNYIITYMLARNVARGLVNFRWVDELPKSEKGPRENTTYYLCTNEYKTVAGERYFETERFNSYADANKHFSSKKSVSKLIKVEGGVKRVVSEKNPKNIVPEIKNMDNKISSISEALRLLK